jgi:RNA polymerase sigma-70 factor (ECF subfamily)
LIQDEGAVWDVSQEVWMAAIKGLRRREAIRNFSAWMYAVAHNKTISHLRKKRRLNEYEEDFPSKVKEPTQEESDPVEIAENAQLIQEALKELPLAQREALTLFYLNDLTLDEIARVLEVPLGTVQSRLHYGRLKLKEFLLKKGFSDEK